jgi:hypothetical protein
MLEQNDTVTITITKKMKLEALYQEQKIVEQKKNSKKTLALNKRMHFYGALGEIIVKTFFDMHEIPGDFAEYFDKHVSGDEYDFKHREQTVDVKTSLGNSNLNGRCFVNHRQKDKKVDYYCFVKIDKERQEANIMGVISYEQFYRYAKYFDTPKMKSPAYGVLTDYLEPFRKFVYGI